MFRIVRIVVLVLALWPGGGVAWGEAPDPAAPEAGVSRSGPDPGEIQWFKDELKISPRYVDEREDVLGVSWPQFLALLFMALFSGATLVAALLRHRRTNRIIRVLLQEESGEERKRE